MATRNEILMSAREATESEPVSEVRYTDREMAQREAYREAIRALKAHSAKWYLENERLRKARVKLERAAAVKRHASSLELDQGQEIVTSAPILHLRSDGHDPFPLTRPALRGKVAPKSAKRRISLFSGFFQAVAIFASV
jgi:hypothetical protein